MPINIDLDRELYQFYLLRRLNIDEYDLINSTIYISHSNLQDHIIVPSYILHKENDITLNKNLNDIINKIKEFKKKKYSKNSKINIYKKGNIIKLIYKNNNVKILEKIYNKIHKDILYEYRDKIDDDTFNKIVFVLVKRYISFNIFDSNMASVPQHLYNEIIKVNHGKNVIECFAGVFNHITNKFCSIFWDYEYIFGSIGNFFETTFTKDDILLINPPFNVPIINKVINHVIYSNKINKNNDLIMIMPNFDIDYRQELNKISKNKKPVDYDNDILLKKLTHYKRVKFAGLYATDNFKFYNYLQNREYPITQIYLAIIIGNNREKKIKEYLKIFHKPDIILN